MGFKRFTTGAAIAALLAATAVETAAAQTAAGQNTGQAPQVAGNLNPAAEEAPLRPAAPQAEFQMADGVVATVNDRIITGYDLRQRILMTIAMTQVQPTPESFPALQQQALNDLIDERLQAQELAKYEVKIPDDEVSREIASMAREVGASPEDYMRFLKSGGIQEAQFRESIRIRIGWSDLTVGRYRDRAKVSRTQVDQTMRQLTESATKPQYLIGEIYLDAARVGGMQEAVNGARQLVQQMVQGAPFQAVARQFSSAPSAARDGDAGWVVQGTLQPALQTALDALEVGQLSNPIPVDGGVYIIYMRDKRAGNSTSLVQMKQVMIELPEGASEAQVTAATARLNAVRGQLTCSNILDQARGIEGVVGADLGEADISDLLPQFQQVARSSAIGAISDPVRSPLGLHLLAVCDRRLGGPEAPSRQQIENRLQNQNFSMLGRRYLRDLREDALIEIKQ